MNYGYGHSSGAGYDDGDGVIFGDEGEDDGYGEGYGDGFGYAYGTGRDEGA